MLLQRSSNDIISADSFREAVAHILIDRKCGALQSIMKFDQYLN